MLHPPNQCKSVSVLIEWFISSGWNSRNGYFIINDILLLYVFSVYWSPSAINQCKDRNSMPCKLQLVYVHHTHISKVYNLYYINVCMVLFATPNVLTSIIDKTIVYPIDNRFIEESSKWILFSPFIYLSIFRQKYIRKFMLFVLMPHCIANNGISSVRRKFKKTKTKTQWMNAHTCTHARTHRHTYASERTMHPRMLNAE